MPYRGERSLGLASRAGVRAAMACSILWSGMARAQSASPPAGLVEQEVRLASPLPGKAETNPPLVRAEFPVMAGQVLLILDGVDVTPLSRRSPGAIVYRPPQDLAEGEHRVELIVEVAGRSAPSDWRFSVGAGSARAPRRAERKVFAQGGLSSTVSGTGLQRPGGDGGRLRVGGNLSQSVGMRVGEVEASVSASARYLKDAPGRQVELTGFLATLKSDKDSLSYGDVAFKGTPLVAPSVARRGLLATIDHYETQVQLFQVGSQGVNGWNGGVDFADYANQMFGGAVTRSFAGSALKLQGSWVDGRDARGGEAYNVATTDGSRRGRAGSIVASGQVAQTSYSAEAGWASIDDRRLGPEARTDSALALQVGRPVLGVNLSASYQRIGTDFMSIASPGSSGDHQQMGLSASTSLGIASLSASASRSNDNLKDDGTRPVVAATSLGGTLGIAAPAWPSVTVSYVRGSLGSSREPQGGPRTHNVTDSIVGALAYNARVWSSSLSTMRSWTSNRLPVRDDASTTGYQLALSVRPTQRIGASTSLGWTEAEAGGVARRNGIAALNLNASLLQNLLNVAGQGALSRNTAGDASPDARQLSGAIRATLGLHELWTRWASYGRQNLAVSWTYSRSEDRGRPAPTLESYALFFSLDLFFPSEGSCAF